MKEITNPKNWVTTQRGEIPYWNPSEEAEIEAKDGWNSALFYAEDNTSGQLFLSAPDFNELTDIEKRTIINNCPIDEDFEEIF